MATRVVVQGGTTPNYPSLNAAVAAATAGDTISIEGTWTNADTTQVNINKEVHIVADADSAHDGRVLLTGSGTSAGHYRLEVSGGHAVLWANAAATMKGIVIKQAGTGSSDEGVRATASTTGIEQCIIYAGSATNDQDGIYAATTGITIGAKNSIIYGFSRAGVNLQLHSGVGAGSGTIAIDGCTIHNCGRSGQSTGSDRAPGGVGATAVLAGHSVTVNVSNSIIVGNSVVGSDFSEATISGSVTWNIGDCIDSDGSIAALGPDTDTSTNANLGSRSVSFGSSAGGNEVIFQSSSPVDLRLVDDATNNDAQDAGATTLTVDIVGTSRPQGSADDIGAFEIVVSSGPSASVAVTSGGSTAALAGSASIDGSADVASAASAVALAGSASIDATAAVSSSASTAALSGSAEIAAIDATAAVSSSASTAALAGNSTAPGVFDATAAVTSAPSTAALAGSASINATAAVISSASSAAAAGSASIDASAAVASAPSTASLAGAFVPASIVATIAVTSAPSTARLSDSSLGPYTLTVTLADASGAPLVGATVTATLRRAAVDTGQGIVAASSVTATTGADGVATLTLWPNARARRNKPYLIAARRADGALLFELERRIAADTTLELAA